MRPFGHNAAKAGGGEPTRSKTHSQSRQTPKTQVSPQASGEEREVIIGLDFGTACTKVTVRDDALGEVYAVPFGDLAYEGHPYLIATRIYADRDGCLDLQRGAIRVDDLKIKLLAGASNRLLSSNETNADASALDICTGYLALVIREALHWYLSEHETQYRDFRVIWQVNIGVPSRSYDNEVEIGTFQALAMAAWQVAVRDEPITIENSCIAAEQCREIVQKKRGDIDIATNEPNLHPEDVAAVPEIIAEVVAYAHSDLRREGTHLLVDVGALTLDVATFVLHTIDGEELV